MSGGGKLIQLAKPFMWFDQKIEKVLMKEPTGGLYLRHGEPQILIRIDGGTYYHEREETIGAYVKELLVMEDGRPFEAGGGDVVLNLMSLVDVLTIKAALFEFFTDAQEAAFERKSNGSSSAGASQASAS